VRPRIRPRRAGYVASPVERDDRLVQVTGLQPALVADVPCPRAGEAVGLQLEEDAPRRHLAAEPGLDGVAVLVRQDIGAAKSPALT
jgi:hypothetical protein